MEVDAFSFAVTALLLVLSSTPASATIPPISSYYVGMPTFWPNQNLTQGFYNCAVLPECRYAASIFEYCNECIPGAAAAANLATYFPNGTISSYPNGTITYNCLCNTYFGAWNSSLTACGACLVTALTERGGGPVPPPSTLPGKIYQDINSYCTPNNAPVNNFPGVNSALTLLYFPGWLTTESYFSQILLYNMTVLVENASIPAFPPTRIPA